MNLDTLIGLTLLGLLVWDMNGFSDLISYIVWQESLISDGMLMGSMFGTDTL